MVSALGRGVSLAGEFLAREQPSSAVMLASMVLADEVRGGAGLGHIRQRVGSDLRDQDSGIDTSTDAMRTSVWKFR